MESVVVVYHRPTGSVSAERFGSNASLAMDRRFELERSKRGGDWEIVVLNGKSLESIRKAHSRYWSRSSLAQSRWDQIRAAKGLPPEILPPPQEGCPTKGGDSWGAAVSPER